MVKANPKVNSWSETTLWQPFKVWLLVMWTSTFHVLFITMDFVFCKSDVTVFAPEGYHIISKFGFQDILSKVWCSRKVEHWTLSNNQHRNEKVKKRKFYYSCQESNLWTFNHKCGFCTNWAILTQNCGLKEKELSHKREKNCLRLETKTPSLSHYLGYAIDHWCVCVRSSLKKNTWRYGSCHPVLNGRLFTLHRMI